MRDAAQRSLALVLSIALPAAVWAEPPDSGPAASSPPSPAQLAEWVKQLDAEDYALREEATRNLTAANESSIEALADGVNSKSPEVAWRASESLQRIAIEGNEQTLNRVVSALDKLSKSGRPGLAKVAQELRAKQIKLRHDRAAGQIRSLGGKLAGGETPADWAGGFIGGGLIGGIDVMPAIAVDFGGEIPVEIVDEIRGVEALREIEGLPAMEAPPERPAVMKALDAALRRFADLLPGASEEGPPPMIADGAETAEPAMDPAPEAPADLPPAGAPQRPDVDISAVEEPVPPAAEAPADEPAAEGEIVPAGAEPERAEAIVIDADFMGGPIFGGGFFVEEELLPEAGGGMSAALALDQDWRGGDEGLKVLGDLPSIYQVSIAGAKLGDGALEHLAALPNLQHLDIQTTKFSADALHKFRTRRPSCRVTARGEAMLGIHADLEGSCILTGIFQGSGAAEAGLQPGDEVVAIDGRKVRDFSDLTIAVYMRAPGEKLKVEYLREGKQRAVDVVLKSRTAVERRSE